MAADIEPSNSIGVTPALFSCLYLRPSSPRLQRDKTADRKGAKGAKNQSPPLLRLLRLFAANWLGEIIGHTPFAQGSVEEELQKLVDLELLIFPIVNRSSHGFCRIL